MEGKDNRSKEKRAKMKQHRKKPPQNTSSSSQVETERRGIVDVADSSDERFCGRRGWIPCTVRSQPERYSIEAENEMNDENAQMSAGDFGLMAQMPTAMGGHFQFSSEKNWESNEAENFLDNTEASEYFTLNLKLLNVGLRTIPFYKRMDYAASMFSREQLQSMENAAEVAEKNYQNVLKEHESNPRIKINSGSRKSADSTKPTQARATNKEDGGGGAGGGVNNAPDELDELLNITTAQVANVELAASTDAGGATPVAAAATPTAPATENANSTNKDDIQQWLDNVLDE